MAADPGFNSLSIVLSHDVKANLMNTSKFFIQFWFLCFFFNSWVSITELACMLLFLPMVYSEVVLCGFACRS